MVKMYSIQLFLTLLAVSSSAYGLEVKDIFPPELIQQADISVRHEDYGLNIIQFLAKYGYPVESHQVTTEDGYILTMHRIPHGRNEADVSDTKKPAVLFMHGIICSSMDWVNMGPSGSLALNLADVGYDVWLGNNRGNTWSRKHVSLDPDVNKKKFFDFSFDECGNYDLPAKIDYILNITGQGRLSYVGHSQGTTQFFALASLRPEYNEKITLMTALAPVAYMQNLSQPVAQIASHFTPLFGLFMERLGLHELLPSSSLFTEAIKVLCHDGSDFQELCADFIFFIGGEDSAQLNRSFIEVIGSNVPAGISLKMLLHYMQEIQSGHFRRYDYGLGNLGAYQKLSPPDYDMSLITAPVALFYGKNDALAAVCNVEQLADGLPNVVKKHLIEYERFSHLDFLWATDVKTLLNDDVVALLNTYNSIS